MHKIFQNVFQKLGLSFLYTYGRFEPKLRRINVGKLKFSSFLIKRLDYSIVFDMEKKHIFIYKQNFSSENAEYHR